MDSGEVRQGPPHAFRVERPAGPDVRGFPRRHEPLLLPEPVSVGLGNCAVARMKVRRRRTGLEDAYVPGEQSVERVAPVAYGVKPGIGHIAVHNLADGVHAGVRPS